MKFNHQKILLALALICGGNAFSAEYRCLLAATQLNDENPVRSTEKQWGNLEIGKTNAILVDVISKSTINMNYVKVENTADSQKIFFVRNDNGATDGVVFVKYQDPNKAHMLQHNFVSKKYKMTTYSNCMPK